MREHAIDFDHRHTAKALAEHFVIRARVEAELRIDLRHVGADLGADQPFGHVFSRRFLIGQRVVPFGIEFAGATTAVTVGSRATREHEGRQQCGRCDHECAAHDHAAAPTAPPYDGSEHEQHSGQRHRVPD